MGTSYPKCLDHCAANVHTGGNVSANFFFLKIIILAPLMNAIFLNHTNSKAEKQVPCLLHKSMRMLGEDWFKLVKGALALRIKTDIKLYLCFI